jgi:hypothetical protein
MASNLGTFISRYHGLGDRCLAVVDIPAKVAAMQKDFLLQF